MITAIIGFLISLVLTPYIASLMRKAGIVGRDIHKLNRPEVPEMGGLSLLISLPLSLVAVLNGDLAKALLVFWLLGSLEYLMI